MRDLLVSRIDDVAPGLMICHSSSMDSRFHGNDKEDRNDKPRSCHYALDAESRGGDDKEEQVEQSAKRGHKVAAVFLHAYGGCKEELVGLALNIADSVNDCYIYDLPGHGESKSIFNSENINLFINGIREQINGYKSIYFIGHSIGARIALSVGGEKVVAISPPGETFFEGRQTELLQTLRVRRVKEEAPYEGLKNVLSMFSGINKNIDSCLVLYAKNDIRSSRDIAMNLGDESGFTVKQITASNHLDIITSRDTIDQVRKFIWN